LTDNFSAASLKQRARFTRLARRNTSASADIFLRRKVHLLQRVLLYRAQVPINSHAPAADPPPHRKACLANPAWQAQSKIFIRRQTCYVSTLLNMSNRFCTSIGFAIWPFIPHFKASCLSSSNALAVIAKMGIDDSSLSSRLRICFVAS
jgi:hypothetical protein